MIPEINEVVHVFSRNEQGTLEADAAVDAISIFAAANKEDIYKLIDNRTVDAASLREIVNQLNTKKQSEHDIIDLLTRLNPRKTNTINRKTIEYILKTNHRIPPAKLNRFFKVLGIDANQELVDINVFARNLVSQLS